MKPIFSGCLTRLLSVVILSFAGVASAFGNVVPIPPIPIRARHFVNNSIFSEQQPGTGSIHIGGTSAETTAVAYYRNGYASVFASGYSLTKHVVGVPDESDGNAILTYYFGVVGSGTDLVPLGVTGLASIKVSANPDRNYDPSPESIGSGVISVDNGLVDNQ